MESIYLVLVVLLFLLAASDLWVGVSNDAVNFMNSAIGSKAAKFRTIVAIAAVGIFCGAVMSNGMMDIARHGVFQPDLFSFREVMTIFLAVMVTDIVLLDIFNSFGMPTSTTVSMVFELLGASFALAMIKTWGNPGTDFGDYINSGQALGMITAIFISVGIAFVFGTLVMYITRLIFTFKYKVHLKFKIGIFGGLAVTAILYFMLFKGLSNLSFMTPETKEFIKTHIAVILGVCFVVLSIIMQILHFLKINVLRIVVLLGTFALAMAFAGNDLVNFIGVPLAGYSSYIDYANSGSGNPDTFMMSSLLESAKTPVFFLIGAGAIMAATLATSKKARRVTETEVNLSRQDAGNEMFGSSRVARSLVRMASSAGNVILKITPERAQKFVESRFQRPVEAVGENAAAYDLLRASVNLVISALLIALGTSLKLPLSTTYVTFMVAMGSSFADRAWGRESAVFRITGVLTVIGGWFITAAVAFISCFTIANIMHYGGFPAQVILITVAVAMLIHSNISYAKRKKNDKKDVLFYNMLSSTDSKEIVKMLQEHVGKNVAEITDKFSTLLIDSTDGLFNEKLHSLRKSLSSVKKYKVILKSLRRREIICLRRT
ncbi:MAG: inorganic phosphate transporter, partial [Prevotellaceae bacterium]|nr:inorganic phosphate transporter [Prevotellaceae bacterium]